MKFIAGMPSAALFLLLLSRQGARDIASVAAFNPSVPSTIQLIAPTTTNNAFTNILRYETSLHAEAIQITMPALSSTMKEGRVVSWLKSEGDEIEAGEAIMVVESDKADMDVEAFEDGYLAKILVDEGEMAPVGDAVALIAATEDEIEEVAAGAGSTSAAAAAEAPPAAEVGATSTEAPDIDFSQIDMP